MRFLERFARGPRLREVASGNKHTVSEVKGCDGVRVISWNSSSLTRDDEGYLREVAADYIGTSMIFDMERITSTDRHGLFVVISMRKIVSAAGGKFAACNAGIGVRDLIKRYEREDQIPGYRGNLEQALDFVAGKD